MTTKPPSPVKPGAEDTLDKIAYGSAAGIPTAEPHDQDRLGYSVWTFLKYRKDPLEISVKAARVRMLISEEEALQRIREYLSSHGVTL